MNIIWTLRKLGQMMMYKDAITAFGNIIELNFSHRQRKLFLKTLTATLIYHTLLLFTGQKKHSAQVLFVKLIFLCHFKQT